MPEETVIKIPSEIRRIKEVSSMVLKDLAPYHVDESRLFDIRLCVEEAVRNAIDHGNNHDRNLFVHIKYRIKNDEFIIEIEDEGKGFDHEAVPDPTSEENIMKGSGRGVLLIKHLMDRVEFGRTGNKITMAKFLKGDKDGDKS